MRVDTSLADSISAAHRSAKSSSAASTHKSSGQSSFKSVLKAAAATEKADANKQSNVAETTQAVPGHAYAEILTGPRAGMYVNTTHNKRAGQAFVMVERNGVEYHIYGTGKHRTVVEMKRHSAAPAATSPSTTAGSVTPDTGTTSSTSTGTATGGVTAGKITTDTSTL